MDIIRLIQQIYIINGIICVCALRTESVDSDSLRVTTQMYFDGNQVNIENGK